ncbi:P-loop containing nucleoside triphosphate hydrolase protein [Whalleya microplaca]|nr:P-loop containing nucleoside triphosphate hydrolase protein [Whalleya microplaca]
MPRYIDTLPTPAHVEPKKLIVLSAPRSGTHGLYLALKQIGFKPYHMVEVLNAGVNSVQIMNDGLEAELYHKSRPYGRPEFDKWFADYDIIIEMPFFMIRSVLKAYPDAKFLLTERDPDKWVKSFCNTIGRTSVAMNSFPTSLFKQLDGFASGMAHFGKRTLDYFSNGYGMSEEGRRHLAENYRDYIATVKQLVPPEQLKVCKLEDGFGWKEVCPYLGVPVPNIPWPSLNTPEEFEQIAGPKMKKSVTRGMIGLTSIVVPVLAVAGWYLRKGGLAL